MTKLADFLEELDSVDGTELFDESDGYDNKKYVENIFCMSTWVDSFLNCGTSACALGWACKIPEFNKLGLRVEYYEPIFEDEFGIYAGMNFFDLTEEESRGLFIGKFFNERLENVTKKQVIDKIREMINEQKKTS